jgi:hypothetical protein
MHTIACLHGEGKKKHLKIYIIYRLHNFVFEKPLSEYDWK